MKEIFNSFSNVSVAAASLAQVHKATLLNGEKVAVKVQRPGINRMIETDLEIMFHLATMMEKHIPEMRSYSIVKIVEEYESSIRKELNFANEASNLEQFGANFQKDTNIYVPQCYRDYTTKKILTLEYIDGIKFSDIDDNNTKEFDPKIIADRGADSILKQIFEYGFFHADPHPGNLLILPDNVICFLDYGMMGTLTQNTRQLISIILIGAINRDAEKIVRGVLRLCEADGEVNVLKLELQVTELINRYFYVSLEQMDIPAILDDMLSFFPDNNLKIPSDLYLLGRALILFQGDGEKLDPDFNVAKYVEPYATRIIKDRLHIRKLANNIYFSTEELLQLISDLPYETREILEKVKNGK
ncbi:MAG: AarF/ABC1/UbiB kinase family protein, partial [Bacteroidetes bacterium]|nr:AarF/ABC1/UbiB kinase family protein [Bacteroidota bacterium]